MKCSSLDDVGTHRNEVDHRSHKVRDSDKHEKVLQEEKRHDAERSARHHADVTHPLEEAMCL